MPARPAATPDFWPADGRSDWEHPELAKEAFKGWLSRQRVLGKHQYREASAETYIAMFEQFNKYLHGVPKLTVLTAADKDVTAFFNNRPEGRLLDDVSRRRYLQLLDKCYRYLREVGLISRNPITAEYAKEGKLEVALPAGLPESETLDLLVELERQTGWKGARDRAAAALMLGAGLRTNELCALTHDMVAADFTILVKPSGVHREHTTLILPDGPYRQWYLDWVAERTALNIPGNYVLVRTVQAGQQLSPSGLWRRIGTWFEWANINPDESHGPNILRNTFARTALSCERYELLEVQEFLGHEESRATSRHLA